MGSHSHTGQAVSLTVVGHQLGASAMLVEILLLLGLGFAYLYWICTRNFNFFAKQGIPHEKPSFPFGSSNAKEVLMGKESFWRTDVALAESEQFKNEKVFGYFMMGQPTTVINDEELGKRILVKDFEHFTDLRHFGYDSETKDGQLVKYMFTNMRGDKWRKVRSMMSGVFTSGKLKSMTPLIVKAAKQMQDRLVSLDQEGKEFEIRELSLTFAMDSFASSGFGIEQNSFKEPDNVFRKMALTLVGAPGYSTGWDQARIMFIMTFPGLSKLLGIPNFPSKPTAFMSDIIERTYRHRRETGVKRNDIIDVCIEEMDKSEHREEFKDDMEAILVANALMLFFAGFDTIGLTISMLFHYLMKDHECQDKIAEEITEALNATNGEITYDMVETLKYTDMALREAMRHKPLFTSHERECTKTYKIPDTEFIIPKGNIVHVYFPKFTLSQENFVNPNNFDPGNFLPENHKNKFAFQGFGQGPRACPGSRYAMLAIKIFLTQLMSQYRVVHSDKSNRGDLKLSSSGVFEIDGGVWGKLEKR